MPTTLDEKADHKRDGDLCTAKFISNGSDAGTTTVDVIGTVVQLGVNRTAGSGNFTLTVSDDTNSVDLWSDTVTDSSIMPNYINNALGGECRGKLKLAFSSGSGIGSWTITIYYIKV